jgi:hypothetical protein
MCELYGGDDLTEFGGDECPIWDEDMPMDDDPWANGA